MSIRRPAFLILLFFLLPFLPALSAAETETPAEKLAKLSSVRTVSADFVQTRRLRNLRNPLKISGHFAWDNTGRFAWRVRKPIEYECILADGVFQQWDADTGKVQRFAVNDHPAMSAAFRSMQSILPGNAAAQEKFSIRAGGGNTLILTPLPDSGFDTLLRTLELTLNGKGDAVEKVRFEELSGDVTELVFSNIRTDEVLPAETWSIRK